MVTPALKPECDTAIDIIGLRAAEIGRRVADAAGDGLGEADVAGEIGLAADHAARAARQPQLLAALPSSSESWLTGGTWFSSWA